MSNVDEVEQDHPYLSKLVYTVYLATLQKALPVLVLAMPRSTRHLLHNPHSQHAWRCLVAALCGVYDPDVVERNVHGLFLKRPFTVVELSELSQRLLNSRLVTLTQLREGDLLAYELMQLEDAITREHERKRVTDNKARLNGTPR